MRSISILVFFTLLPLFVCAQTSKESKWVKVHDDDEGVTIYYNSNITTDKKGRHIVWVKAVYHSEEWQNYFSDQLGIRTPVMTTKTKAMYDNRYCFAMVRQVQCFNKAGKLLYDSGDDSSAGWGFVNASDPVGIVGEYLGELDEKKITSTILLPVMRRWENMKQQLKCWKVWFTLIPNLFFPHKNLRASILKQISLIKPKSFMTLSFSKIKLLRIFCINMQCFRQVYVIPKQQKKCLKKLSEWNLSLQKPTKIWE